MARYMLFMQTHTITHIHIHIYMYMHHIEAYQQLEEESDDGARLGVLDDVFALGPLLGGDGAVVVDVHHTEKIGREVGHSAIDDFRHHLEVQLPDLLVFKL